jgi:hypothetical protein
MSEYNATKVRDHLLPPIPLTKVGFLFLLPLGEGEGDGGVVALHQRPHPVLSQREREKGRG